MIRVKSKEIYYLDLSDFKEIIDLAISIQEDSYEDIPPFESRYPQKLESVIEQIQFEYYGQELYKGVVNKAVWFFYCLIKNHPFFNGNKRIAVASLYVFLKWNVSELYIDEDAIKNDLFRMAIKTSESKPEDIEKIKKYLKRKIRSFIIEF